MTAATMVETAHTAGGSPTIAYVHVETRVERYVRHSNEWADIAARGMEWGSEPGLIEHAMSAADHWANLAAFARFVELALERLP